MRIILGLVLICFVCALPFVGITMTRVLSGKIVTSLDVCSKHSQGNTVDVITIIESVYDMKAIMPVAYLPVNKILIPDIVLFSPIDKPPVA